jgi:hypothetical protein
MLTGDLRIAVNKDLASNVLTQDVMIEEQLLTINALARDVTIETSRYWQAMCWHKMQQ